MKTTATPKPVPLHIVSAIKGKTSPVVIEAGVNAVQELEDVLNGEIQEGGPDVDLWANRIVAKGLFEARLLLRGQATCPTPLEIDGALTAIEGELESLVKMRETAQLTMAAWGISRRREGLEEAKRRLIEHDADVKAEYLAERKWKAS